MSIEAITSFSVVKISPPKTIDDINATVEKLKALQEEFETQGDKEKQKKLYNHPNYDETKLSGERKTGGHPSRKFNNDDEEWPDM
jgi:hypothetical protein